MEQDTSAQKPFKVLHLEVSRIGEKRLKTSLSSGTLLNRETLQAYEETHVCLDSVTRRSQQLLNTLNKANRNGRLSPQLLQSLKEHGQVLRDELFGPKLKEKFNAADAHYLTIRIDEQLVHIPWELLYDGRQFLCRRFAVGRLVQTRQDIHIPCESPRKGPLCMLILADLDDSLAAARKEGKDLRNFLESVPEDIRVMMRSANVDVDFLRTKIRSYDWVHFAGHAEFGGSACEKTGWRLSGGWFTSADAAKMSGTGTMPELIFANACQSARPTPFAWDETRQKRLFGLVSAFLFSGTRHYVGTSWEIPDQPARQFALAFYRGLADGNRVGDAVRDAREELIQAYGEEQIIWASYLLYGDPTYGYVAETRAQRIAFPADESKKHQALRPVSATRAAEEKSTGDRHPSRPANGRSITMTIFLCTLILAIFGAVAFFRHQPHKHDEVQQQATAAYQTGELDRVLDLCRPPSSDVTPSVNCLLLRAHVLFGRGDVENAKALYEMVGESSRASTMESSEALIGLGRIASTQGREKIALAYYQQAADRAPKRKDPFLAMAILNDRSGNVHEAMALLNVAKGLAPPNDPYIDALHRSLSAREALAGDTERIALINGLVEELAEIPPDALPVTTHEDQSHRPVSVCVLTITSSGYSLQEGAAELLTGMIENHLQKIPAIRIVDRHLMTMTLSELKIGTSALSAHTTRLKRGHLHAARLMVSGRIIFNGPETQIALRCIDTETSRIVAVILIPFENRPPLPEIAKDVSEQLIQKIDQIYP